MIKLFDPKRGLDLNETKQLAFGLLCVIIMAACVHLAVYLLKIIFCI